MNNSTKKLFAAFMFIFGINVLALAQLPKMPKLDKTSIPKIEQPTTTSSAKQTSATNDNTLPTAQPALAAGSILKPTLRIVTLRDQRYWKQPDMNNYWCWIPRIMFEMAGPISDSSHLTVEYTTPDGKPWFTDKVEHIGVPEGRNSFVEIGRLTSTPGDKRSTIATGLFGFKITLKDDLKGLNKEIYSGKFKVNKFFAGTNHPNFKNQYVFYVDQDWSLPIGYLWLNGKQNPTAPILTSSMWFRGEFDEYKLSAHLFYNGKEISNTKSNATGKADNQYMLVSEGDDDDKARWEFYNFIFYNVRAFDNSGNAGNVHLLKRNPGNYEIKVILDGDLVRTTSFTVGSNGEIVDNGAASQNGFGGFRMVLPVKVNPAKEGTVDMAAWKTDAFYSNPLAGFAVP